MENLPKKIRSKKLSTRVDLTAMVSVSFLLIIFFMVTIELAKPKALELNMPDNDPICGRIGCVDENRIYTLLLDDNNKIVAYSGLLSYPLENPKKVSYNSDGIHRELTRKKESILEYSTSLGKPKNGPIVIIKPSEKCNYKNLIDILEEMRITNIDTYVIVNEFTPEETKLLASK